MNVLRELPPTKPEVMAALKSWKSVRKSGVAVRENINVTVKDEQRRAQKLITTIGFDKFYNKIVKYCRNLKKMEKTIFRIGWFQKTIDN